MTIPNSIGVYAIENLWDGTVYVGSTGRSFRRRWNGHCSGLRHGNHGNIHLQRAWNKYGKQAFRFVILEELKDPQQVIIREQDWLDWYMTWRPIYNFALRARHSCLGRPRSEETKKKLSCAHMGKKLSKEHKKRIGESLKGRKHSEESKRKMSIAAKGKVGGATPYPTFRNLITGEVIPPGKNLTKLCREKGLDAAMMNGVKSGRQLWHNNWVLATTTEYHIGKAYPAFYNVKTGEVIPPGFNFIGMCRKTNLDCRAMQHVTDGDNRHHKNWALDTEENRKLSCDEITGPSAKDYPSFIHRETQEVIPAGHNLRALCQKRKLGYSNMLRVVYRERRHHRGWELACESEMP